MNRPTKKRMMLQSTFAIRVLAVVFAKNGKRNSTNDPPASATRGSHAGVGEAKNATATPTVTPSVTTRPVRGSRTGSTEEMGVRGTAGAFRNASQTGPIAATRHGMVTGSREAVEGGDGMPGRIGRNA